MSPKATRTKAAHAKPTAAKSTQASARKPAAKASSARTTASIKPGKHRSAPLTVYRTGHGNHGLGTTKAPPRYTAALPPVVPEPAPPVEPVVTGAAAVEYPDQLRSYFNHLQALEAGGRPLSAHDGTVRTLQFGDSHTAADMFTGRMRALVQAKFGNGGAGFSFAGHPFAGYRILGTSRSQSPGWIAEGVHFTKIYDTQLGLGGVANTSTHAGDDVVLDAPCSRMEVQYLDQPGGGSFSLLEDGVVLSTAGTDGTDGPATLAEPCAPPATSDAAANQFATHHFEVQAQSSAPVRLLGFVTEQPGATYEAIGLNGAEASLMLRWNQRDFQTYLKQRDPALIVLAYGTNEAGNSNWTYAAYRAMLGRLVDMLHQTTPDASILLVGPPDRSTRVGRGRRAGWTPYAATLHITEAQRDTCREHGCAFWSWRDRMGGLGSMNRWAADGLAQGDHVHFTSSGYVRLADFFYSDILAAYHAWQAANPPAAAASVTLP